MSQENQCCSGSAQSPGMEVVYDRNVRTVDRD